MRLTRNHTFFCLQKPATGGVRKLGWSVAEATRNLKVAPLLFYTLLGSSGEKDMRGRLLGTRAQRSSLRAAEVVVPLPFDAARRGPVRFASAGAAQAGQRSPLRPEASSRAGESMSQPNLTR